MRSYSTLLLMTMSLLLGCSSQDSDSLSGGDPISYPDPTLSAWGNKWWLEKTSRTLRGGIPLSDEESARYSTLNHAQVVDQLLADPHFSDTILDFSLNYIGFKQDLIKTEDQSYQEAIYQHPQAVLAAKEAAATGDFFKIFNIPQKIYMPPLKRPVSTNSADDQLSDADLREKIFSSDQGSLDNLIQLASNNSSPTDICTALKNHLITYVDSDPLRITNEIPYELFYSPNYYSGPFSYCSTIIPGSNPPPYDFTLAFNTIKKKNEKLFALLRKFDQAVYHPTSVTQIAAFDFTQIEPSFSFTQFNPQVVARALQNSSTNYNRKRAAYVLKRYLCDDLTPIEVENPSAHAGDVHGTNPSCFACHYKLDPMAGFFRYYGGNFTKFSDDSMISFDDNFSMPIAKYLTSWQNGTDKNHPLNVGYIRSTESTASNFYGSSLDDLFNFLKVAPEARRCLVKRVYEYTVSPEQTLDGQELDYLTDIFNKVTATSGSIAGLKTIFKTVALGHAFSTQNADHDTCYDLRANATPSTNGVPCKVSSILAQNCVKCHSSVEGQSHLDLSRWQKFVNGSYGFPHTRAGADVLPSKTFLSIMDHLNTTDPDERMPYLSDMPSQDRQTLYTWVNGMLSSGGSK